MIYDPEGFWTECLSIAADEGGFSLTDEHRIGATPAQERRITGASNQVEEAACLIWAELCPGLVMGDDDLPHYEAAAKAVLALPPPKGEPSQEWDAGKCGSCDGSGNATCDARGCKEPVVGFNDDGEALCQNCMMEWTMNYADGD